MLLFGQGASVIIFHISALVLIVEKVHQFLLLVEGPRCLLSKNCTSAYCQKSALVLIVEKVHRCLLLTKRTDVILVLVH